jgi:hypothetical protein
MNKNSQIVKTRDGKTPIIFWGAEGQAEKGSSLVLADGSECSWVDKGEIVGPPKLRARIEPWLTALFQSEHLALLVGSGLSNAVHYLATGGTVESMAPVKFSCYNEEIETSAKESAKLAGRAGGNIEDQIRVVGELLRGLEIIGGTKDKTGEEKATL